MHTATHSDPAPHDAHVFDDAAYDALLTQVDAHCAAVLEFTGEILFTTDASGLYDTFLANVPAADRKHHDCRACRSFVNRYGGLVTIDSAGRTHPLAWAEKTGIGPYGAYAPAVQALHRAVSRARVTGVFLVDEDPLGTPVLGTPVTGPWKHFALCLPGHLVNRDRIHSAHQVMADKAQDFGMLNTALSEYPQALAERAVTLLATDQLYRSEKVLGVAKWFAERHAERARYAKGLHANLAWRAVAVAPPGFAHVRSSMIGTLLDDLTTMSDAGAARSFARKMHPLQYQRPTAPPAAGNLAQAEAIVAKLGIEASLARRFAKLEDLEVCWVPRPNAKRLPETAGVFAPLAPSREPVAPIPAGSTVTMTFEKFRRTILPDAIRIDAQVPVGPAQFCAYVTAVNPEAPPILQWDKEANGVRRNPVSWYVYHGGSMASAWNLAGGWLTRVTAISLQPNLWQADNAAAPRADHHGKSVLFVLDGARDTRHTAGSGYFPELLRSELHEVRATLEAHAKSQRIAGRDEATACGLRFSDGSAFPDNLLHVTLQNGTGIRVRLDRWD